MGFNNCFTVDNRGRSGAIGILWRSYSLCSLVNYSINFVNLDIHDDDKVVWSLTAFYDCLERRRRVFWDLLKSISTAFTSPWVCMRDFNDLLNQEDKIGLQDHSEWYVWGFRETVVSCNLLDLPLFGYPYT